MQLVGRIQSVTQPISGVSEKTGKEWHRQQFVLETIETNPKRAYFELKDGVQIEQLALKVGDQVLVDFFIQAWSYNDRWHNSLTATRVSRA